jgi:hypothetical protein
MLSNESKCVRYHDEGPINQGFNYLPPTVKIEIFFGFMMLKSATHQGFDYFSFRL